MTREVDALQMSLQPLPAKPVVVGFSGGLDSTVLLHLLASQREVRERGLRAIHVNHGLHADADAWTAHCLRLCAALDLPLTVVRVRVDLADGRGPEGAARAARLAAFTGEVKPGEILALAHHRDDQAETVLLRLLRGAGGDGLAAMRRRSRIGGLRLWRPLLDLPRAALRDYARAHAIEWIEDPSNAETGFDRNFLRHRVLPVLAPRWPHAAGNLARSAGLLAEQASLLATVARADLAALQPAPGVVPIAPLLAHPRARRARILRAWLGRLAGGAPPANVLAAIERDLLDARTDSEGEIAWSNLVVHRWRDALHAAPRAEPLPRHWTATWDGRVPLALPDGSTLALSGAAGFDEPVQVGARQGGERIRLPGREHRHALKHVLQDRGIPPWIRARMPLLSGIDGELLAAGAAVRSARLEAWLQAHGAALAWTPAG